MRDVLVVVQYYKITIKYVRLQVGLMERKEDNGSPSVGPGSESAG